MWFLLPRIPQKVWVFACYHIIIWVMFFRVSCHTHGGISSRTFNKISKFDIILPHILYSWSLVHLKLKPNRKQKPWKLTKNSGTQFRSDYSLFSQIYQYFTPSLIWLIFFMLGTPLQRNYEIQNLTKISEGNPWSD